MVEARRYPCTMMNVIKVIEIKDAGIEVQVAEINSGFSVVVRDVEANETFDTVLIFKTKEAAITKAEEIAANS